MTPRAPRPGFSCLLLAAFTFACIASVAQAQVVDAKVLTPPPAEGPVEVEAGYRLLTITEINDESETV